MSWVTTLGLQASPLSWALLLLWLSTMLSLPILTRAWGERARTPVVVVSVLLQALTVASLLVSVWGLAPTLRTLALVLLLGWVAEVVGSHTGMPFGRYSYTHRLQPQLGGVPMLIPCAWWMMLPPAWAVGAALAGSDRGIGFVLAGAFAFTAWDLFLDPQMVAWGLWVWQTSGDTGPDAASTEQRPRRPWRRYFGIPWTNYAGWLAVSSLITWVALAAGAPPPDVRPALIIVYALTWALETFGQLVFFGLTGPALTGGIVMGACLLLAWLRM